MADAVFTSNTPHFLKPLLPGFQHSISIPLLFFIKYLKCQSCERAILRSTEGSRRWPVKIKDRLIEDGWEEFIRDHDLHAGDLLMFKHAGHMVFDVIMFDTTSECQIEFPPIAVRAEHQKKGSDKEPSMKFDKPDEELTSTFFTPERPHFVVTVTPTALKDSRVCVPKKFAMSNGLSGRMCDVTLFDPQGKSWVALLRYKKRDGQVRIGRGLENWCVGCDFKEMESVMFELLENGKHPKFKLHRVASNSSGEAEPNGAHSKAGCSY